MKSLLLGLVILMPTLVLAQDACPVPKKLNDILDCLKEKHQLVQIKNLDVNSSRNLDEVLGQRPNPVLEVQSVHGGDGRQTQLVLAQELDLGGRLKALRSKGSLIHDVKKNELAITKEEVIETVLLNVHHLVHLNETLKVNREVHASLSKVLKALKKRPVLTPEQEASLLNFKLQQSEVRNIIALLEDEEEELLLFFLLNGGYKKEHVLSVMEDHYHPLELIQSSGNLSLNLERLGLETKLAERELDIQKALPWEGISIGPMYMDDKIEGFSDKMYGVALTMPIPVWQTNKSGKALATIVKTNSTFQFSLIKKKEELQKDSLLERIVSLKRGLKEMPSDQELFNNHQRVEKLYTQGLITPTSFLDSHRIWRDVISSKLELEEKILKLTIDYYRLNGKLHEVHL